MADTNDGHEIEVKLRVPDAAAATHALAAAGFSERTPRLFEANTVYDLADGALRARGELLRVREVGPRTVLTFKGPPDDVRGAGRYRAREEREIEASDATTLHLILRRLGYVPVFRYEKWRAEWERSGEPGVVTVDQTPIGDYLELEGAPDWIDRTAATLGRAPADYVTDSYGALYQQYCVARGIAPTDMTFS